MQICSNQFQLIRVVWYALDTALNTTTFIVFKDLLKAILRALLKEASKGERNPTPALDLKTNLSMQCIPSKGVHCTSHSALKYEKNVQNIWESHGAV